MKETQDGFSFRLEQRLTTHKKRKLKHKWESRSKTHCTCCGHFLKKSEYIDRVCGKCFEREMIQ